MFHCEQNTGYAIETLEKTFEESALLAGYKIEEILWSYSKVFDQAPRVYELGYKTLQDAKKIRQINQENGINTILAFDLPFPTAMCREARNQGINNIVSYWGASMSSSNRGLTLLAKRIEWYFRRRSAPTEFIFESQAMRLSATHGRGVPHRKTSLIPLGVDTDIYFPAKDFQYAHGKFGIPIGRKIIFYSGHMEERKGVRVLIEAMKELSNLDKIEPFHLLICGNKEGESQPFEKQLSASKAKHHVTFAGYRKDIPKLMRSAFVGAIASTGWDSFTMSSIEMLASGLPLIVSDLQGLKETIDPGKCGEYIKPGDSTGLAKEILRYSQNPDRYSEHSEFARQRAIKYFSKSAQVQRVSKHLIHTNSNKKVTSLTDGINSNAASEDN